MPLLPAEIGYCQSEKMIGMHEGSGSRPRPLNYSPSFTWNHASIRDFNGCA